MDRIQRRIKPDLGVWARFSLPVLALLLAVSCVNDNGEDVGSGDAKIIYGTFFVSHYEEFPPYWANHATISGRLYDGPTPHPVDWQEQAASGSCRVLKAVAPFCDPGCGSTALCSAGGVCTAFPNAVNAGKVTVQGVKTTSGAASFVMDPVLDYYQSAGVQLAYPPYAEGELVTFTAAGSADAPAFSLSGRGHFLPKLLNDSIILDGNPILVKWTPPGPAAGPSTLLVYIDVSHHGGIKGTIECVAEDDGEVEIDGSLVNQLKGLGISGYPHIDLIRRTITNLEGHGVTLVLEARVLRYVTIPGLTSCRTNAECSEGQFCQPDFKCQ